MDTRAASGLGSGIVLGVIGAILYFAVNAEVSGIEIDVVGVILMVAGVILAAFGLISAFSAGFGSSTKVVHEREVSPSGSTRRERHEERI